MVISKPQQLLKTADLVIWNLSLKQKKRQEAFFRSREIFPALILTD